jgi:cell division protein FtsZ
MFGFFGRGRKEKQEPRMEKAAEPAPAPRMEKKAPARKHAEPAVAQQQAAQAAAISPRAAAEDLRQTKTQPGDDLFNGVTAEDRFEIPAFLRRQANTGT